MTKKRNADKSSQETDETGRDRNWANDQSRHEYYYDDAHGYEVYDPDNDDNCDDDGKVSPSEKLESKLTKDLAGCD
ncbi:MAG: hypothetical protein WBD22_12230 [Pyrinomonadaceae bacterium]